MPRLGLALGGGGARGLSHIPVLELLDELRLRPSIIAGTSMGALIGALYASGVPGRRIREMVEEHLFSHARGKRARFKEGTERLKWIGPLVPDLRHGGMIKPDRFLRQLFGGITSSRFEDLEIPLVVVAADFWSGEEVILREGPLLPAIRASIALPGVFPPHLLRGRVLVDGGLVDVLPYDCLAGSCDVTVAVDVGREMQPGRMDLPNVLESILGAFDVMQSAALERRLATRPPDILVSVRMSGIRILDFGKAEMVFLRARPAVEELRRRLAAMGLAG
ncbi:MAG: patatin-like phospholipase family protein [Candidatus Eisenbacteria bacterium]|nr:patatin-like phospholipase family protein [Candidatus Eisenbacteria bacterium]